MTIKDQTQVEGTAGKKWRALVGSYRCKSTYKGSPGGEEKTGRGLVYWWRERTSKSFATREREIAGG